MPSKLDCQDSIKVQENTFVLLSMVIMCKKRTKKPSRNIVNLFLCFFVIHIIFCTILLLYLCIFPQCGLDKDFYSILRRAKSSQMSGGGVAGGD